MTTLYKITNQNMQTYNNFVWKIGHPYKLPACDRPKLCTERVLHAYVDPILGLLFNPMHANYGSPRLFEAEGVVAVSAWDKVGCFELTLTKELPLPHWYMQDKLRWKVGAKFALLCAETGMSLVESVHPDAPRLREIIKSANACLAGKRTTGSISYYSSVAYDIAVSAGESITENAALAVSYAVQAVCNKQYTWRYAAGTAHVIVDITNYTTDFVRLSHQSVDSVTGDK